MLHKTKDNKIISIDGSEVEYPKMTDIHLLNTIRYIERLVRAYRGTNKYTSDEIMNAVIAASSLNGDMAQFYADREIDFMMDEKWTEDELCEKFHYDTYFIEAQKRELL